MQIIHCHTRVITTTDIIPKLSDLMDQKIQKGRKLSLTPLLILNPLLGTRLTRLFELGDRDFVNAFCKANHETNIFPDCEHVGHLHNVLHRFY